MLPWMFGVLHVGVTHDLISTSGEVVELRTYLHTQSITSLAGCPLLLCPHYR